MGYYADGSGSITFDCVLDEKTFDALMTRLKDTFECDGVREWNSSGCKDAVSYVDIWANDKYYGDDVEDALKEAALAGPIMLGEICYHGEDGEHWRFVYENGCWNEESGHVEYGDYEDPGLPFEYMATAIRRFAEIESGMSESSSAYQMLTKEFGFSDSDLRKMKLDWLLDLRVAAE